MYLLLCIYILLIISNIYATDQKSDHIYKMELPISSNKGVVGVASVAGIASRNGGVATVGGVKYFGPLSSSIQSKSDWSLNSKNMANSIKIGPGAIAFSSSKIGDNAMRLPTPWPILHPMPWPIYNHFIPSNIFDRQRNIEEWFHKDIFENLAPNNQMTNTWLYPSFDPFFNY